ncbi:CRISPR subtype III-A/MTUBE-associated RAMP protein Csm4 [uncultured Desulfobacterium sp.]|uniref:CRISPR system Cms protein Csm4 n=1 Tax=uncultured Desulfobacterium sp. TaxID=201089 RepID=A0A445MU47_9BACT|nr:CRISPR subtype III-A/MTUBE-associated RAMP protein Csm4 [uncultured Desulfobacterium sp.]
MKLYAITLKPSSGFGTILKGDTLFGHFCWQAAYDSSLVEGGLELQMELYPEKPFAVFSSAFPKFEKGDTTYVLKRPEIPFSFMLPPKEGKAEDIRRRKEFKKKKWMLVSEDLSIDIKTATFLSDHELLQEAQSMLTEETKRQMKKAEKSEFVQMLSQSHNTINRMTQTTGTGMFAPYEKENLYYYPETELVIFVLIEESATDISRVARGLERIGNWGFGRDASTGLGRFDLGERDELTIPSCNDLNACYVLSPCVPEKDAFTEAFFTPFVRFGKHGDRLATFGNPFKNPVIMADEGAVFIPKDKAQFNKPYIGQAITHVSKAMSKTVVQGYAPYLPLKLEVRDETSL